MKILENATKGQENSGRFVDGNFEFEFYTFIRSNQEQANVYIMRPSGRNRTFGPVILVQRSKPLTN
jgi:hypothetical protein